MSVATLSITDLRRRPERLRALLVGNTPVILTVRDETRALFCLWLATTSCWKRFRTSRIGKSCTS